MSEDYSNIRELLGSFIGKRVVDITQHDEDEWETEHASYVMLMFDDGNFIKFNMADDVPFEYSSEEAKS